MFGGYQILLFSLVITSSVPTAPPTAANAAGNSKVMKFY
jgi:hypothetical protein